RRRPPGELHRGRPGRRPPAGRRVVTARTEADRRTPAPVPAGEEPTRPRRGLPHVPALDGLRGVAVAAVLLYHADRLEGGWLGVDLFFVLSGYLITALMLTGWRAEHRVSLGAFW